MHNTSSIRVLPSDAVDTARYTVDTQPIHGRYAADTWLEHPSEILNAVQELSGGGPGFTASGKKEGVYSERKGTITFSQRCKWKGAYGCKKQTRIVQNLMARSVDLQEAVGWCHKHDGPFLSRRGLPPDIKMGLTIVMAEHARITPTAACNILRPRPSHDTEAARLRRREREL